MLYCSLSRTLPLADPRPPAHCELSLLAMLCCPQFQPPPVAVLDSFHTLPVLQRVADHASLHFCVRLPVSGKGLPTYTPARTAASAAINCKHAVLLPCYPPSVCDMWVLTRSDTHLHALLPVLPSLPSGQPDAPPASSAGWLAEPAQHSTARRSTTRVGARAMAVWCTELTFGAVSGLRS